MNKFTILLSRAVLVAVVVIAASFPDAHAGNWSILTGIRASGGAYPTSFTVADFDNDGDYDLAVCNFYANGSITIVPGTSTGAFGAPDAPISMAHEPIAIVSGDFDSDGNADVATANYDDGSISVLLGKVNRTFNPKTDYAAAAGTACITRADLNADGIIDLATSNFDANNVSVFLGVGDGTFLPAINTPVGDAGNTPNLISAGDVNNDGLPDVAVSNWDDATVRVLLGNGDGTFAAPGAATIIDVGPKTWGVCIADLDEDGIGDLAATSAELDKLYVMISDGLGGFSAPEAYPTGYIPSYVTSADINMDGYADLVVANGFSNNVQVFFGIGGGAFSGTSSIYTGIYPMWIDTLDFTMDGMPDMLVACYTSNAISTYKGAYTVTGTYGIDPALAPVASGTVPGHILAGDFDEDYFPDVVVTDTTGATRRIIHGNGPVDTSITPQLGANGPFLPSAKVPDCSPVTDFNRDTYPDMATANAVTDSVDVRLGNAGGTFDPPGSYPVGANPGSAPSCVVIDDINNDGWPDMLTQNTGEDTVSYLLNNKDSTFVAAVNITVGNAPMGLVVRDFNKDKYADFAVANSADDTISVMLNRRNGTFTPDTNNPTYATGLGPSGIFLFELNRDGYADLVVTNFLGNSLSILTGKTGGVFNAATDYPVGPGPVSVAMADFDLNGWPDLAVANSDATVSVLQVHERSSFTTAVNDPAMGSIDLPIGTFSYETGTNFTITATPTAGFAFTGWSGNASGTTNPLDLKLQRDTTVTANFAPGPYVVGIAPANGIVDDIITVTGLNFGTATGRVYVGSVTATVTAWSDTTVSFKVPRSAPNGLTTVKLLAGGKNTYPEPFTVRQAVVTSVTPGTGVYKDAVLISGTDFGPVKPTAYFVYKDSSNREVLRALTVTGFTSAPDTVSASVPLLPGGVYVVRIKNSHGYSTDGTFTILGPAITGLSTASGIYQDRFTVNGTNFGTARPTAYFVYTNSFGREVLVSAPVYAYSGIALTIGVPNLKSGVYSVRIKNLHGYSNDATFTVLPPALTSVVPAAAVKGSSVTVNGLRLGTTWTNIYFVRTVGGREIKYFARVTARTDTVLTVTVPNVPAGACVVRAVGLQGPSNDIPFTIL